MNKNNNSLITFRTHKNNSFFDREENFEVNYFFFILYKKTIFYIYSRKGKSF